MDQGGPTNRGKAAGDGEADALGLGGGGEGGEAVVVEEHGVPEGRLEVGELSVESGGVGVELA